MWHECQCTTFNRDCVKVIIEDPVAGESYEFPCYRWLAKDEDDGQISRELVSKQPGDNAEHVDSPPPGTWLVLHCMLLSLCNFC